MEWKKEIQFQRDQALALLPVREDFMVLAASLVVGLLILIVFIALYSVGVFYDILI